MIAGDNADAKWSEKMNNGEDGLRTLECLRGRLLAERAASKVAKEDAEQIGNKLIEVENQLSREIKLRNRAEKKLKALIKKLESKNIPYVPDNLEHSILLERSEISSESSTGSSCTYKSESKELRISAKCDNEVPRGSSDSSVESENSNDFNVSRTIGSTHSYDCPLNESISSTDEVSVSQSKVRMTMSLNNRGIEVSHEKLKQDASQNPSVELTLDCADNASLEKSEELALIHDYDCSGAEDNRLKYMTKVKESNGENEDECVDNSLALVLVDVPKKRPNETIDPAILDATVKDVLDALRHAKESLQSSMERRHMIRVGSR